MRLFIENERILSLFEQKECCLEIAIMYLHLLTNFILIRLIEDAEIVIRAEIMKKNESLTEKTENAENG